TVGDTFGNPSRSAVVHTTYTISPTLLNEVAFNYNGNVINIVPFAATGLTSLALPSGYDSTNSRLFTGPNNLTRIPNIYLGDASSYQELAVQDSGKWNNVSWAAYVQDNWRVNRRLTLNLGLRWDGVPHTYEANDRMGNFYPSLYDPAKAAVFNSNASICSA